MPSKKILEEKQNKVQELAEKFKKAKMIILTEYRGISVEDDTKLRSTIRTNGDEYGVYKNSVITHAAKEAGIEGLENLEGPTAVVVGYEDYVAPAKAINDYAKANDFYTIKSGVMDGKMVSASEVKKLANLPSKETLYAMLASALLGNIRNFAVVIDQVRQKQEENA
ncbi:MAG: 50S ribosomal protein L10 [Clostridia bacterium]|nr:50S ribosomal protein L10 [Clostridia bacterium]